MNAHILFIQMVSTRWVGEGEKRNHWGAGKTMPDRGKKKKKKKKKRGESSRPTPFPFGKSERKKKIPGKEFPALGEGEKKKGKGRFS